jgi:hypothetical protein
MHIDKAITWVENKKLDALYESLREKHYSFNHKLKENYSETHSREVIAKSIYWGTDGQPKIVCSILRRDCWPNNVYRILNRLWKTDINTGPIFDIDRGFGILIENQVEWCLENGAHGMFMSRQGNSKWQSWSLPIFKEQTDIEFIAPPQHFLTCDNETDSSCWQQILFYGDNNLLNTWKQR